MSELNDKDKTLLVKWLDQFIEEFLASKTDQIDNYIQEFKNKYPDTGTLTLAKKLRNQKSLNNGFVGAVTGIGGFITLPVTVPADLIVTWKIQIALIYSIANIFGFSEDKESLKTDIYLILAGKKAAETLKEMGVETLHSITKKGVQKHLFREISGRILRVIPQKIIVKAGEKSVSGFVKLAPLAGAPFGFVFDYFETRKIGTGEINYYKD